MIQAVVIDQENQKEKTVNLETEKGKRLLITESLTSSQMQLLGEAQKKYDVTNVWTFDGRVKVKESKVFLYKS